MLPFCGAGSDPSNASSARTAGSARQLAGAAAGLTVARAVGASTVGAAGERRRAAALVGCHDRGGRRRRWRGGGGDVGVVGDCSTRRGGPARAGT